MATQQMSKRTELSSFMPPDNQTGKKPRIDNYQNQHPEEYVLVPSQNPMQIQIVQISLDGFHNIPHGREWLKKTYQ